MNRINKLKEEIKKYESKLKEKKDELALLEQELAEASTEDDSSSPEEHKMAENLPEHREMLAGLPNPWTYGELFEFVAGASPAEMKVMLSEYFPNAKYTPRSQMTKLTDLLLAELVVFADEDMDDFKYLLDEYRKLVYAQTELTSHRQKRFGGLRKIIKERFGEGHEITGLTYEKSITRDEFYELREEQEEHAVDARRDRIQLEAKAFKKLWKDCYKSENLYDMIICAMMACGARVIEILSGKVSNYFPVQKDNFLITVVGLAKTQEPTTVVRRLLFIDSTNFIYLINDIRARLHSMKLKAKVVFSSLNNNEMTSIISKPLNSRIKSFDVAITKSHELRKAYCVVQYSLLSPQDQSKISYAQFVADTLAHVSIGSSIRYTNINLVGNMDSPEEEEEEKEEKKEVEEEKNELEKIEFKNIDKETVYVLKPKKPSFGKGLESILKTMDIMHKLRIKISNAKMRHLGYGGTVMGKPEYIESRDGLNGKL